MMAGKWLEGINSASGINSLDVRCDSKKLCTAEESAVGVYLLQDCSVEAQVNLGTEILSVSWSPFKANCIAAGCSMGCLFIVRKIKSEWKSTLRLNLHVLDISTVVWTQESLITCSFDNFVKFSSVRVSEEECVVEPKSQIKAHEGWVKGICVSGDYLISQGSDFCTRVWHREELVFVLEYVESTESFNPTQVPSCNGDWVCLSGTRSGVTGEGCATLVKLGTWQVVEVPLTVTKGVFKRSGEEFVLVEVCVFLKDKLVAAGNSTVFVLDTKSLHLELVEKLPCGVMFSVIVT